MENNTVPWIEKYRPINLDNIVLDSNNKHILNNVIKNKNFSNMLFYGPPGTGKTTTIINLIKAYQENIGQTNKGLMIHLNASDDRGIDTIRNQILSFVNSTSLFSGSDGIKFVVLDEVDYMTLRAQQGLKYLIQKYNNNVKYCLICNYINKIDISLQTEFIKLRFSNLPSDNIKKFINTILENEYIKLSDKQIEYILQIYKSDIRSMINYIQLNKYNLTKYKIVNNETWEVFTDKLIENKICMINYVDDMSISYNLDKKEIIKLYINYLIFCKTHLLTSKILYTLENIIHNSELPANNYVTFALFKISEIFKYHKIDSKVSIKDNVDVL